MMRKRRPKIKTVWDECQNRQNCRMGLRDVWVRTESYAGKRQTDDWCIVSSVWDREGKLTLIDFQGFRIPAEDAILMSPWPIVCCKPKVRHAINGIPEILKRKVFERDGSMCVQCGAKHFLHLDHIYPVSRGGKTTEKNLRVLCRPCNLEKGAKLLEKDKDEDDIKDDGL
jgi:HNH endonuclease